MGAADASTWLAEHRGALIGLPVDQARAVVAEAGLRPRILEDGAVVTAEFRGDRVDLRIDATDRVAGATAG